jgi:hypothetical protein
MLVDNWPWLVGAEAIAAGVAGAGAGAALLIGNDRLVYAAVAAVGVALAGFGVTTMLIDHNWLYDGAATACGVALAGYGLNQLADNGLRRWLQRQRANLTADPDNPVPTADNALSPHPERRTR